MTTLAISARGVHVPQVLSRLMQALAERARVKRTRQQMLKLDDRILDDIGLNRIDIMLADLRA